MESKRLKIGFLSSHNYFDRLSFSGILWCMYQALERHADVVPLGRPYHPSRLRDFFRGLKNRRIDKMCLNGHPNAYWDIFRGEVEKQLKRERVDIVFAPVASSELSKVDFTEPLVYASDVTFQLLKATYGVKLSPDKIAEAEAAEKSAISRATGLVYSSTWAADSAIRDYSAAQEKIRVIPFGANLTEVVDATYTREKIGKLPWKLLFVGVEWHRKGGDIALETIEELARRGIRAELTIVGAMPPQKVNAPGVRVMRFIDKRRERGRKTFRNILLESHLMIFPSRADCSPIALCEAAAYGIPVVASDVGGIRTIVSNRNGRLLPSSSTAKDYAAAVLELMEDEHQYRELVRSSRERYEEVLNWDTWSKSLITFCEQMA